MSSADEDLRYLWVGCTGHRTKEVFSVYLRIDPITFPVKCIPAEKDSHSTLMKQFETHALSKIFKRI